MMHHLLFHETIIVNEAQGPTNRPIMCLSVGWRNGDMKGFYYITIIDNYAAL